MSIDSLQTNHWTNPWARNVSSQSEKHTTWSAAPSAAAGTTGSVRGGFSPAVPTGPWSSQGGSGSNSASTTPANPLRTLASDIQAMLIQAQGTAAAADSQTGTAAAQTSGGATAASPEQTLATDLRSLLSDLQSGATANARTANANPADAAGRTEHHRHHHRHEDGGGASAATAVASSSTAAGTTTASAGSAAGFDQAVSRVFAADIAQALRAYGGASAATTTPVVTT